MKKKLIIVLAVITMLATCVLLTGCGGGSEDEGTAPSAEASADAGTGGWAYIEENGKMIVGLDDTFAPMGFRDENNELVGFDIDLAKAVGEELGIEIEFKPIDWDAKEAELSSKKIDCIWNGMSATPERQESMSLSNKYLNNKIVIMSLNPDVNVKSVDELKDLNIGTQEASAALEAMQADENWDSFGDKVREYGTYDEAIMDMQTGRLDCIVIDLVAGEYKNANIDEELYVSDFDFGDDFYAIGFRKGDDDVAQKVNDALQKLIDDGTAAEISQKWFGKDMVVFEGYDQ